LKMPIRVLAVIVSWPKTTSLISGSKSSFLVVHL